MRNPKNYIKRTICAAVAVSPIVAIINFQIAASEVTQEKEATSENAKLESEVKAKTDEIYGKLRKFKDESKTTMEAVGEFLEEVCDTKKISKRACGASTPESKKVIIKYLRWRLSSETVRKTLQDCEMAPEKTVTKKKKNILVNCKLVNTKQTEETVELIVNYTLGKGGVPGKIIEIKIVAMPIIGSMRDMLKGYCDQNKLNLRSMNPEERVKVFEKCINKAVGETT
ncbi:MAG: hypothetical protein LBF56_01680 [Holosporales bacterium]|jgi:hypothetical protein|nr:hypothetical protein [Holosporales bacterium]